MSMNPLPLKLCTCSLILWLNFYYVALYRTGVRVLDVSGVHLTVSNNSVAEMWRSSVGCILQWAVVVCVWPTWMRLRKPNTTLKCFLWFSFQTVFEHIGELLTVLITLDEIMNECSGIHENWKRYKRYSCDWFYQQKYFTLIFHIFL